MSNAARQGPNQGQFQHYQQQNQQQQQHQQQHHHQQQQSNHAPHHTSTNSTVIRNNGSSASLNHNINQNNSNSPSASIVSEKEHKHHSPLRRFLKKLKPLESRSKHTSKLGKPEPIHPKADIFKKYGQPGKLLGTGASGSVNLLTSKTDPLKIYAVKKFRSRLPAEQEADYKTKVLNEYKVGEFLTHQNLIHTFELLEDYSHTNSKIVDPDYFIVMEYCPYDFFNLVMSGLMELNEVSCYFKQIVNGVHFLHENGLAHRDLKLDNCVVSNTGILKLIDFGSAVQFRKEVPLGYFVTEDDIMLSPKHKLIKARGVVGSDPYLSPEVLEPVGTGYDPRTADVWSVAIIYCCMILKRFPWKLPKLSDPSYRSFAGPQLVNPQNGTSSIEDGMNNMNLGEHSGNGNGNGNSIGHGRHNHHANIGPDRLLRLLPHDSRTVIKHMLTLDPKKRYLMPDVIKDSWVQSVHECKIIGQPGVDEHTISSENHQHHLVTEDDLKKISQEKESMRKLKEQGLA